MAAGLGDLIQIADKQTYQGEDLLNIYYYRVTSLTGLDGDYLAALVGWFELNVLDVVKDIQNDGLTHTLVEARNLSNNIDFYEEVIGTNGTDGSVTAERMPSWVTVNFKLVRESLATRNGSKRFSGLTESRSVGNTYTMDPGEQAAVEAALSADIVLGVVTVAEPVIVQRPINPPVGTGYVYSSIGDAIYTKFGTQNTRKP